MSGCYRLMTSDGGFYWKQSLPLAGGAGLTLVALSPCPLSLCQSQQHFLPWLPSTNPLPYVQHSPSLL